MINNRSMIWAALLIAILGGSGLIQSCVSAQPRLDEPVPPPNKFDTLLKRELTSYFESRLGKGVTVQYDLLRRGPTQVGVAAPKFYVWVKALKREAVVTEGAARVATDSETSFSVTHYLNRAEIRQHPQNVSNTFPKALVDNIRDRAK